MKKTYLLLMALAVFSFGFSQTIATVDRTNGTGPNASDNVANMSSIGLTRGPGLGIGNPGATTTFSSNSFTIGGNLIDAQINGDFIEWSITANAAFEIDLEEIDIRLRRNANGPGNWQMFYSLDGFTTAGIDVSGARTLAANTTSTVNIPGLTINSGNTGTITLRIYAWGALTNAGNFRTIGVAGWSISPAVAVPSIRMIGSVSTTSTNSIESDIISTVFALAPTQQNIDYSTYNVTSGLNLTNSVPLGAFSIRDGGATAPDSDTDGTTVNSIQFEVVNSENIAALAILDLGTFSFVSEVTSVTDFTLFSGLNLVATDGGTREFVVYATFKSAVTDNDQVQLNINLVSTPITGSSLFPASDAGGAATSIAGDDNRIEVSASQFAFDQQPTDGNQSEVMIPSPTILAVDSNLNQDIDANFTGITVSTSPSSSINIATYDMVSGEAVLNNVLFSDTETGISLVASGSGLSGTSSTFNINGPLLSIAGQNFDTETSWTYVSNRAAFGTVADWGNPIGYLGEIALADASPLNSPQFSNEIYGENDLNDTANPFAILTFADTDVSIFSNIRIEFDWQVSGYVNNANDISYRLVINGSISGGWIPVFDGNGSVNDAEGRVKISIPDGTATVGLQLRQRNNLVNGYSGLDNFKIVSEFNGLVYTDANGWKDNIEPDATTGAQDALVIDGTYNLSGNVQINNYVMNSGAETVIPVAQSLVVNGNLSNNGTLQLNSASNTYSSLIVNGVSSGEVTYNRHVNQFQDVTGAETGKNDLISAPVTSASQNFLALRSANSVIPSGNIGGVPSFLFGPFDNNANDYINFTSAVNDSDLIELGIGYRTASTTSGGSNFTFLGDVETGTVTAPITIGTGSIFNLVGNPYPSYIKLSDFLSTNNSQFALAQSGVYGYDGEASDGFTIWNQAYSDANPMALIAPGQGFLIASQLATGVITFDPSMRSIGTSDDFIVGRPGEQTLAQLKLQLSNDYSIYNTDLYFNNNASLGMDSGYDSAMYESTTPDFAIYSHLVENNNGTNMAAQSVGFTDLDNVTIPLGINVIQGQQATISILNSNIPDNVNIILEDNVTNTFTDLKLGDYIFTPASTLTETGRFFIKLSSGVLSSAGSVLNGLEIYTNNDTLVIKGLLESNTTFSLYDIQGRIVANEVFNSNANIQHVDTANLSTGIYIVKLENKSGTRTQKVILK